MVRFLLYHTSFSITAAADADERIITVVAIAAWTLPAADADERIIAVVAVAAWTLPATDV